jgi:hypothetical protein
VRRIDLALLRTVTADAAYGTAFVARVFDVTPEAVQGWCRAGKLAAGRCPFSGQHMVPGSAIREKAGGLLQAAAPVEYETAADRGRRANRAVADIDRIFRERKEQARARR